MLRIRLSPSGVESRKVLLFGAGGKVGPTPSLRRKTAVEFLDCSQCRLSVRHIEAVHGHLFRQLVQNGVDSLRRNRRDRQGKQVLGDHTRWKLRQVVLLKTIRRAQQHVLRSQFHLIPLVSVTPVCPMPPVPIGWISIIVRMDFTCRNAVPPYGKLMSLRHSTTV